MQTKQLLCWIGMTDTEHTKGVGSEAGDPASLSIDMLFQIFRVNFS